MEKMKSRRTNKKETSDSEQSSDSSEYSLKKENSSISELADNVIKCNKRPGSPIEDDSLADFKLPKLNSRSNLARNGVKLLDNPKKSTRTRSNPSRNSKKKVESNQMSIESSFFKPSTAFVCPLCLKTFNESNQQIAHSKNCAVKNKISTRQLIAATELHERQAEERKAIGLPAAPVQQQPAKKTPKFKRMSTSNDPDVELAIALSKSLSEAQEIEDLEEAVVLAAESNEKILEMSSSQRKSTLINFGFITNKPAVSDCSEKSKKKKMGPTILQTRTEEVRSRLLAERIAEVIVDNVIATQRPISPDNINEINEDNIINFKSMMLKEIYRSDCKLWNGSVGEENVEFYYIESLYKFIRPAKNCNKLKSEDKLSVHKNEDDNYNKTKSINEKDCISPINKNENEMDDIKEKPDLIFNLLNNDEDSITNEQIIENISKYDEDRERKNENKDEKSLKDDQLEGLNPLALSWSKMINSKIHSDVIIHVKHEKFIFSHFLVLWARCREIEKDFISNNTDNSHSNNENKYNTESFDGKQQWKIMWEDVEYQAGIIFLEFIYCGCIISLEILKNKLILNDVKKLIHKYKVVELNGCLKKFELQIENLNTEDQIMENNEEKNKDYLYTEQNEDENEEYSSPKRDEEKNPYTEEDKNKISKSDENLNTDFQFESSEFSAQIINDNDINVQEKDNDGVNKINTNGSSTKNQEVIVISEDELELSEMPKSATKTYKNELLRVSFMSASPDIFDGMETMNLGNSFGKKHQNNRDSDNDTAERNLGNDHDLYTCIQLNCENKEVIKEHEEEIISRKSFQSSEKKHLNDFTRTVEKDSEKQEFNLEKNYSANTKVSATNSQVTNRDDGCEKLSKSISATRNNLSLFIEKIQRRNARFLESDTDEDDSIIMNPRKKKNPFKISRPSDNDSGLLNKFRRKDLRRQEEENLEIESKVQKKSALSIFEDDLRKRVATEMEKRAINETHSLKNTQDDDLQESFLGCNSDIEFVDEHWSDIKDSEAELKERKKGNKLKVDQKSTHKFDSILANHSSFQSEEANSDDANESMYTKYKKTHRRNSIDKYRTALKNYFDEKLKQVRTTSSEEESNNESSEDDSECVEYIEKSQQSSPEKSSKVVESPTKDNIIHEEKHNESRRNKRISLINQKSLTELSSFDFYAIEDIPEEGRTEDDENSSQNSQEVINRSIDLTVTSDEEKSIKTNQTPNEEKSSIRKSSNKKNLTEDCEMYEIMHEKSFDSMDWNEEVEANYSSKQDDFNDKSKKQPDDKDYSLIIKSHWEPHPPKVDWKNERSNKYSFTEFPGTPTVTENVTKILQECGILGSSYQSKDKPRISIADILSPIVLSSATDSDDENGIDDLPDNLFLDFGGEIKGNANDNYDQNNEEMNFTRLEYEGGAHTDFAELSNLRLSTHLPITSSTQYSKTSPASSRTSQVSRRSTYDFSSDEEEKLAEEAKRSKSRRCSSVSPLKNKSQRLLQVKSQSEGNFSNSRRSLGAVQSDEKTKNSKRKRNDQKNEEICNFLNLSPSKVDISFDVLPKECYDQLSSPELKRRLESFGLKNQERHRAVKLLNFIWDQMHPLVPENLIPDNVNDNHSNLDNNKNKNLETNLHNNLQQINEEDSSEDDSKDKEVNCLHRTGFPEEFEFSDDCDDNGNANNDKNQLVKKIEQNFEKLLKKDNILHRKILMYEPISLDIFAEKLKESGFQVKPKILADFLDSECISFFIEAPKKWSGNIRKNRKK